jgi:hypothetical protein
MSAFGEGAYRAVMGMTDEQYRQMVESEPPVRV